VTLRKLNMDLSAPVDEGMLFFYFADRIDELEHFRSRWRQEIQKGRGTASPILTRTGGSESSSRSPPVSIKESSSGRSEGDSLSRSPENAKINTPLEVFENAILKERQGSLSEAVIQYRKAFKVIFYGRGTDDRWIRMSTNSINKNIFP
jgi:hypothetical protein